jgi:hypothetical protein
MNALSGLDAAPLPLTVVGATLLLFGGWPLWWVLKRAARRVFGRLQPPVSGGWLLVAMLTGLGMMAAGLSALALGVALSSYRRFTQKTEVAEVQCIELGTGKLRLYLVPIEADGSRGATETYELSGDQWTVGGDVLRFRPFLTGLGVSTVYRLSRVEGRWTNAADANAHAVTAFDRGHERGRGTAAWLTLYRSGQKGPFSWLVAGAHGQAVSQLPDRLAVFRVYVTPNGYVLEKRAL